MESSVRVLVTAASILVPEAGAGAGGGSGLLVGLSREGKLGRGHTDWGVLAICLASGAAVILGAALVHCLWKRCKRRSEEGGGVEYS